MTGLDELMTGIAEQVRVVDLSDRVRASSRRLTVRRYSLAAAAAFTAVGAVSGAVWVLGSPGDRHVTPDGTPPPTVAPATPPTSAPPSAKPPAATTGPASYVVDRPAWNGIPGTLYYVGFDGQSHLWRLRDGMAGQVLTPKAGGCALAVSPDGGRLMWGTSDGAGPGDLVVAGIDGTGRRTLLRNISCQGGAGPFWLPDSRHLLVSRWDQPGRVLVDVTTGAVSTTPLAAVDSYVAWSPSGTVVAYQRGNTIVVCRPDGSVIRRVTHGDETPSGGFSLQGVSDDGRRAVVGYLNSDPGQVRYGFRLVDTVTGRNLGLPKAIPSTEHPAIYPVPGGQLLVRVERGGTRRLYLIGADGAVRDQRTEPGDLAGTHLLLVPGAG